MGVRVDAAMTHEGDERRMSYTQQAVGERNLAFTHSLIGIEERPKSAMPKLFSLETMT